MLVSGDWVKLCCSVISYHLDRVLYVERGGSTNLFNVWFTVWRPRDYCSHRGNSHLTTCYEPINQGTSVTQAPCVWTPKNLLHSTMPMLCFISGTDNNLSTCTLCVKKRTNFETVWLKIVKIDFDDIRQKYSKDARIEFARFSFRVGLLFYQLLPFTLSVVWQAVNSALFDCLYAEIEIFTPLSLPVCP